MGLIKAAVSAVSSTLKDQWKEAIRCEEMTNDVLMVKKTTPTGVITNKSTIIVAPGQCAIIYDNGRVIDATAEEGVYNFDSSSSPSFFAGQFGAVFKEMWQRFTYSGATAKQQAVFFFNIKEIMDNKFGTPAPVPFQDWSHLIPNQMTGTTIPLRVGLKCFGKYTFKIDNPALFMNEVFTVQLSMFVVVISNSLYILSYLQVVVNNFFIFLCYLSNATTLISYHVCHCLSTTFFIIMTTNHHSASCQCLYQCPRHESA